MKKETITITKEQFIKECLEEGVPLQEAQEAIMASLVDRLLFGSQEERLAVVQEDPELSYVKLMIALVGMIYRFVGEKDFMNLVGQLENSLAEDGDGKFDPENFSIVLH